MPDPQLQAIALNWLLSLAGNASLANVGVRRGSCINTVCYTSPNQPVLGTTWTPQIDATNHSGATLSVLLGRDRHLTPGIPVPGGELLIDLFLGNLILYLVQTSTGGVDVFNIPVPNCTSLVNFEVFTQGAILGGSPEACNALDAVVGL